MNIAYLPLDSRPCNARFPVQLAECAGGVCAYPGADVMDLYTRPSNAAAIAAFLAESAKDADAFVISADQLAFGSLIASRSDALLTDAALERLKALERLRKARPGAKIYVSSVIMRSSIGTFSLGDLDAYYAMAQYSQAYYKYLLSGADADASALDAARAALPRGLAERYHRVRERNHAVNRACVDLCASGVIDRLLLLQEDAEPTGFHRLEQNRLAARIRKMGVEGRAFMHNGADEGASLSMAALLGAPMDIEIRDLYGGNCSFVARYEDRPFMENILGQCRFAGVGVREGAEAVLCVLPPKGEQTDVLRPMEDREQIDARDEAAVACLQEQIKRGRRVGLLDLRYANGGSIGFMELLAEAFDPLLLSAYSGWNTASNALGTALAQLSLGRGNPELNRAFTAERLFDDLIYQADVRFQLNDSLAYELEDPYNIQNKALANMQLAALMRGRAASSPVLRGHRWKLSCALPWARTFEADVRATLAGS